MDSPANVGALVRARRKAQNLTREQLAVDSRCSYGMIVKVERGDAEPSIGLLTRVAAALHCAPGDLLPDTQPSDLTGAATP
jgi:transcriptional regulator with XRE-family HTH domain